MNITSYVSNKIKVLNFVAILMVLYIHSVYSEALNYPMAHRVQEFFAFGGLSLLANPLFYCISGFLFFIGMQKVGDCYPKLKKRCRTLLVPFLFWNMVFVLWFVVLQNLPVVKGFVNSDVVGSVFGNGIGNGLYYLLIKPAAFQLWFLRDLILYVFFSPIIYILLKKLRWAFPSLLFMMATVGIYYLPSEVKVWGLFFFVLGGYVALYHQNLVLPKFLTVIATILYFGNAVVADFMPESIKGISVFFMLCGVIAIWGGHDLLVKDCDSKTINFMIKLGGYSFFVYCFHEPVFNIIKKVGLNILGINDITIIVLYLINPIIMYAFSVLIAKLIQYVTPRLYKIVTGGR